ncbi:MAG: Ribonuclease HII [Candidatus Woesebacteria bacterium GW2011_GWB1_45_5]|uniref:Ribonuclease n=1 Tax=Candidatus Woesebacteria bacterium GW2011_GWB1_45_5 TaxID=1618581 RepID=A0A0G1MR82_9BACT|nr:MAG: Ribonuclease HII [Candidatus Woesebacteria bacterium GW2011_GWB1_45_5]
MKIPNFRYEKKLWYAGHKFVAGVDEVGRGCFAGPVVAGCVVFNGKQTAPNGKIVVNDSKKMTPKQRERADKWIKENALAWGIGEAGAGKINKYGMAKAARMAFRKAISEARKRLNQPIDYLLADAFFISFVPGLPAKRRRRQLPIVRGDTKSISIAAASIIAKVYRDKLMLELGKKPKYRKYGWGRNKGYGTKEHQTAILKYGTTRQHRKKFVETWINNSSSSRVQLSA